MGAVRSRKPENGRSPVRAAAYVRISAEEPTNSADRQKTAIRLYARTQKLRFALVYSDQNRVKHN